MSEWLFICDESEAAGANGSLFATKAKRQERMALYLRRKRSGRSRRARQAALDESVC
ncbi:hypothetical protein [Lysinibacillus sp. 3P01SB]|uniref:hypothetical protein n=1 Tax=Lysinibacillus sp. 3P01SB TaxID=3132284 RepID=UPI0039A4E55E